MFSLFTHAAGVSPAKSQLKYSNSNVGCYSMFKVKKKAKRPFFSYKERLLHILPQIFAAGKDEDTAVRPEIKPLSRQ